MLEPLDRPARLKRSFARASDRVSLAISSLDLARRRVTLRELEARASDPALWEDPSSAALLKQLSSERAILEQAEAWEVELADVSAALQLAGEEEEGVEELMSEADEQLEALHTNLDGWERRNLMGGEFDRCDAVLSLVAGAGGVDAMDWTRMMLRMYERWAERLGYRTVLTEQMEGEEAGLKSASLAIHGEFAYGQLRSERGTHRLVRLSPFNSANKRQAWGLRVMCGV